jgi:hypothetical protein
LVVFYLLVLWLLPLIGIYYCFLIAYPICFIYLYLLNKIICNFNFANKYESRIKN